MLVGAAVHIRGWIRFVPAVEIVNFAQLVLGTTTGCRLPGTSPWEMTHILVLSLGATAILLALTPGFAAGMSQVSSYGEIPLLLAYSPCGLAEMSLVAVSIDSEVAFVAAHHSIRVFIVMLGAAPSSAILKRWM
jgi:hypothetical protein